MKPIPEPAPAPAAPTDTEKLLGGFYTVINEDGQTERIALHGIKVREYELLLESVMAEKALIAHCVDRPVTWVENLTPTSYELLASEMERLNPSFFAWAARMLGKLKSVPSGLLAASVSAGMSRDSRR